MVIWSLVAIAIAGSPDAGEPSALVTLSGPRAALDPEAAAGPLMTFTATAESRAPATVTAIEVGIMLGATDGTLAAVDAARLFEQPSRTAEIAVVRQWLAVDLGSGGRVPVRFEVPLDPDHQPGAFLVHLLAYRVSDPSAATLLTMLASDAGPDGVAAALAVGLVGGPAEKNAARRQWGGDLDLIAAFGAHLAEPVPERPSHHQTLSRVFASLALGVLGGVTARAALDAFRARPEISAYDEPLQVLRASRLTRTRLEVPLAFAVPAEARGMSDVVAAAVVDLDGWDVALAESDDLEISAGEIPAPASDRGWIPPLTAAGVGLMVFAVLWWGLRRVFKSRD